MGEQNRKRAQIARARQERVYFIEAVGLGVVKIGYAKNIAARITKLMTGCPAPLRLLGTVPGGLVIEQHYHERFAADRAHGEWFRRTETMDAVIATLDQPAAPPTRAERHRARMQARMNDGYAEREARLVQRLEEKRRQQEERFAAKRAAQAAARRETAEQIAARL